MRMPQKCFLAVDGVRLSQCRPDLINQVNVVDVFRTKTQAGYAKKFLCDRMQIFDRKQVRIVGISND